MKMSVNEVLKIPERLYLRDSNMNMLLILDRHEIKVNCCKNAYSHWADLFCLVLFCFYGFCLFFLYSISAFIGSIIFQCDILGTEMFR